MTLKLQLTWFPDESLTEYATTLDPTLTLVPDVNPCSWVKMLEGQLSLYTGLLYVTRAWHIPASVDMLMLAGHAITGSS